MSGNKVLNIATVFHIGGNAQGRGSMFAEASMDL